MVRRASVRSSAWFRSHSQLFAVRRSCSAAPAGQPLYAAPRSAHDHFAASGEAGTDAHSAGRTADVTSNPVHYLSLTDVSERLRRGELKPTALSEMIVARIGRHEGAL